MFGAFVAEDKTKKIFKKAEALIIDHNAVQLLTFFLLLVKCTVKGNRKKGEDDEPELSMVIFKGVVQHLQQNHTRICQIKHLNTK